MAFNFSTVFLLISFCFIVNILQIFAASGGFYADNGLQQSIQYKTLARRDKQELQQEILHLLGLDHRPKPRRRDMKSSAPKYLLDMYNSIIGSSSKHSSRKRKYLGDSDFIVSFVNKVHHNFPHLRHDKDRERWFWFDVSNEVQMSDDIVNAEFRMFRNISKCTRPISEELVIGLYALSEEGFNVNKLKLVKETVISNKDDGWIALNVTDILISWIAFPGENLGLYLKVKSYGSSQFLNLRDAGLTGSRGPKEFQPFMVAYFKAPTRIRRRSTRAVKKRNQETYYEDGGHNPYSSYISPGRYHSRKKCQRWTLYVSFRDLGWEDWIIAPDGYGAFYCDGECSFPLNAHMNATNHAIVKTLVHLMDPSAVPKPCCAPTQLSAITVLYFDDNSNVILKKYRNMVVKSCGCH